MQSIHNSFQSCTQAFQTCTEKLAPLNLCSKEARTMIGGSLLFTITTIVLTYLLVIHPGLGTVGFSTLGAIDAASLVIALVGLVHYNKMQRKSVQEYVEEIATAPEIKVEEIVLEETEVTTLDYITQVRQELPPLFDGIEEFLVAFVTKFYTSSGKEPQNIDKIREAINSFRTQIDGFLKNPKEVLRVAVGIAAYTLIDENKMGELLRESDTGVLAGLSNVLAPAEKGLENEVSLTRQILQVLCSQASPRDPTLRKHIKEVRSSFEHMQNTHGPIEAVKEAEGNYKTALIELIDYLYAGASLPESQIEVWTVHLIPPFLENWKGALFDRIDSRMRTLDQAFDSKGIFNDSGWSRTLSVARTWLGRPFVKGRIQKAIAPLPLITERKKILEQAAQNLFDAFIDPAVDGLFDPRHPFRQKVVKIVKAGSFTPPQVEGTEWKAYIDAYNVFFKSLATQLESE